VAAGFTVGLTVGTGVGTGVGEAVGDGLAVGDEAADALDEALGLPKGELQPRRIRPAMATPPRGRMGARRARISSKTTRPNRFRLHRG
jgi:hypothetical protein